MAKTPAVTEGYIEIGASGFALEDNEIDEIGVSQSQGQSENNSGGLCGKAIVLIVQLLITTFVTVMAIHLTKLSYMNVLSGAVSVVGFVGTDYSPSYKNIIAFAQFQNTRNTLSALLFSRLEPLRF